MSGLVVSLLKKKKKSSDVIPDVSSLLALGICCPGGIFTALEYEPWQLQRAMSAHHSCGPDGINLIQQLPTG